MGFYDTTLNEGAMHTKLNFMDLAEDASIRDLPTSSSLLEDALMGIAESEENYNNIMKACAYNELKNFQENGTEYVFTEASAGGFIQTAKQFFAKIWQKIQELFKKFAVMIGRFVQSDKTFVEKNKSTILAGLANIPSDATYKGYKYDGLEGWASKMDSAKAGVIDALEGIKQMKAGDQSPKPSDDWDYEVVQGKLRSGLATGKKDGELSQSEFNKAMYEKFRGSEDKEDIDINSALVTECMKTLTASAKTKETANKAYNSLKEYFGKVDTALNKVLKAIPGTYGKEGYDADNASYQMTLIKRGIDSNKALSSAFQTANGIFLTCLKDYSRQCKAICVKVATYKDASKAKHEGAAFTHYGDASFLENVVLK